MAQSFSIRLIPALALLAFALGLPGSAPVSQAQEQKKGSAKMVTVQAAASSTDAAGNQQITLKLIIEKGWYIYANPLDNDAFKDNETVVTVAGPNKPLAVKTLYPKGKLNTDSGQSYKIYEGDVTLTTTVRRANGDTAPLQVNILVNSCSHGGQCLPQGKFELTCLPSGDIK